MIEYLQTDVGKILFILFDIFAIILILAINYKWFSKLVLDVLIAFLLIIITSPAILIGVIGNLLLKDKIKGVFTKNYIAGKNGEISFYSTFNVKTINSNENTEFGDFLIKSGIVNLPILFDILFLRISFVGNRFMLLTEANCLNKEENIRFKVRPGICDVFSRKGSPKMTYPRSFLIEQDYAENYSLGRDILILISTILVSIRNERQEMYGEVAKIKYDKYLLENGEITQEDYDENIKNVADIIFEMENSTSETSESNNDGDKTNDDVDKENDENVEDTESEDNDYNDQQFDEELDDDNKNGDKK